jgi:CBS domain-containing membrane protein
MLTTKDLMLTEPERVTRFTPVQDVISLMKSSGNMQVLVVDGERLEGIITARDLCHIIYSPNLHDMTAQDCMTARPVTVAPHTPLYRAAEVLNAYKFSALPVVQGDKLVGIITARHFLGYCASKWDQI